MAVNLMSGPSSRGSIVGAFHLDADRVDFLAIQRRVCLLEKTLS